MGIATRLGPWLLGTVKETTGTTAGTIRNVGATVATQISRVVTFADAPAPAGVGTFIQVGVLPAGAMITDIAFQPITQFTAASGFSYSIFINGNLAANRLVAGVTISATQRYALRPASGDGSDSFTLMSNVGATDAIINAQFSVATTTPTAGSGVFVITYIVRNPDGSIT